MSSNTFNPYGPTFTRTVGVASAAISPVLFNPPTALTPLVASLDYRFTCIGTQPMWIQYAFSTAAAPAAVIPADGTSSQGFMLMSGETRTYEFPYGTQFACISGLAGSTVYATIGAGNNS